MRIYGIGIDWSKYNSSTNIKDFKYPNWKFLNTSFNLYYGWKWNKYMFHWNPAKKGFTNLTFELNHYTEKHKEYKCSLFIGVILW